MWPDQQMDGSAALYAVDQALRLQRGNPIQSGRLVALQMQILATDVYERFTVFGMAFVGGLASFIAAKTEAEPALSSLLSITILLVSLVCGLGSLLLGYVTAQSRIGIANQELINARATADNIRRKDIMIRAMFIAQWRHLFCFDRAYLRPIMRGVVKYRLPNPEEVGAGTSRIANAARNQSFLARAHLILGVLAAIIYVVGSINGR